MRGARSEDALESAIAQPLNAYFYGNGDLYEIAAAYAFHIAESQAYFDGNKRAGVQAAADFLEINSIDTSPLPEPDTFEAMIRVATYELDRSGFGCVLTWRFEANNVIDRLLMKTESWRPFHRDILFEHLDLLRDSFTIRIVLRCVPKYL